MVQRLRGVEEPVVDPVLAEHIATLSRVLGENRIDYGLFDTSKPLDHALASFLTRRERMVRVR